jgi:hypothetical protein
MVCGIIAISITISHPAQAQPTDSLVSLMVSDRVSSSGANPGTNVDSSKEGGSSGELCAQTNATEDQANASKSGSRKIVPFDPEKNRGTGTFLKSFIQGLLNILFNIL